MVRARERAYYAANAEKVRAANRRYGAAFRARRRAAGRRRVRNREVQAAAHRRVRNREVQAAAHRRYRKRHPRKVKVRRATRLLQALGGLPARGSRCADCGAAETGNHHPHYDRADSPFVVIPLCHRCHMRRHFAQWRRTGGGPVKHAGESGEVGAEDRAYRS